MTARHVAGNTRSVLTTTAAVVVGLLPCVSESAVLVSSVAPDLLSTDMLWIMPRGRRVSRRRLARAAAVRRTESSPSSLLFPGRVCSDVDFGDVIDCVVVVVVAALGAADVVVVETEPGLVADDVLLERAAANPASRSERMKPVEKLLSLKLVESRDFL